MIKMTLTLGAALLAFASTPISAQQIQRQNVPGINKFYRVDKTVATGGAITAREMAIPELKKRGIKTVVNLAGGPDAEQEGIAVEAAGMKYLLFEIDPMKPDTAPVDQFLEAAKEPANYPMFIHSVNAHRAGMVWFLKRVLNDKWTPERASLEAVSAGLVNDNAMASMWWKYAFDYMTSHTAK